MDAIEAMGRSTQRTPTQVPTTREPGLPTDGAKRSCEEAAVGYALADLELSLVFCSMTEGRLTREDMIRKTAYLLAEARSFAPGGDMSDWFCAERQVDCWLAIYGLPHHFTLNGAERTSV
jgi:Protein of unknown function (DUF2934)